MNLLIVDDDDTLRSLLAAELGRFGHAVATAATGEEGIRVALESEQDVVLLDLSLPDQAGLEVLKRLRAERPALEVVVLTAHGTIDGAIAAMKLGAYEFLQKPCALAAVELAVRRALEHRRLGEENARLKDGLRPTTLSSDLIGSGPDFEELKRFIGKVAPTDSTVLIRGETGTGKEMVAAALHRASDRRDHPFVAVDCASLNDNLLQSELFGHERGAFTGAVTMRHGLFESADGGTLFLDEVGDVSPALQASLLRVLETSRFRRVGGTREIKVNVRLIAATNRDLERMIPEGQFRQDLFFRLNAIHVELRPLRRRLGDLPFLADHFLARHNARYGTAKSFATETIDVLRAYAWPGNVRELRHAVERAAVLAEGDVIHAPDLPPEVRARAGIGPPPDGEPVLPLVEVERRYLARVLAYAGGHRARAAALLGISERNLYRKIQEFRLDDPAGSGRAGR
ncbi:MAG TPA: sigma-54 dependent transcriptional regulator [Anaeromyxobacter sp.]